jgi:AbrB family looped-hinge helix DNA binding protein
MPIIVDVGRAGRVTLPAEIRRQLGLEEGARLEVEIRDGVLQLRPVVVIPRDDAWAYTAEHRALLARALDDIRQGRLRGGLGDEDLRGRAPAGEASVDETPPATASRTKAEA